MKVALLTSIVSPHQIPLAKEIVKLVLPENYRYIFVEPFDDERVNMGWGSNDVPEWCISLEEGIEFLRRADLVYCEERYIGILSNRICRGLKSYYVSERWFKHPIGFLRILHPKFFLMAIKMVRLLRSAPLFAYLPQGIHAARDMARLCGLFAGDLRCLFRAPKIDFERSPGGRIWLKNEPQNTRSARKYCLDKMRMWGYFVEPSKTANSQLSTHNSLKVLWVGRLLKLKHADTIIKAVGELSKTTKVKLDIYGTGAEETKLKKLAGNYGDIIKFYPPVPIADVRELMREHDVYVFASDGHEGWGAVVSEALEEGMNVIGTYEAGSSATILPESNLFHAGDWYGLLKLLVLAANGELKPTGIGNWTAKAAAKKLLELV